MSLKAKVASTGFRPHCKTHQSHIIANWFRDFAVSKITVSSFDMAVYFAQAGWQDILVAFPFNPLEIKRLIQLSSNCRISILIDHIETIMSIRDLAQEVGYYIDIDTGYGRTGIKSDRFEEVEKIMQAAMLTPKLAFNGFYCHAGHSYKAKNRSEIDAIHKKAITDLKQLKDTFSTFGPEVLYGDTPNCSIQTDFEGVDEITPGNFVFYDLTQAYIGSCQESDIAVAMICPVTGKYPDSQSIIIHGGAVHFSKERLLSNGQETFGKQVGFTGKRWTAMQESSYITSLSQEHGTVKPGHGQFEQTRIGDLLVFLPVHSCLTANLMRQFTSLDGKVIEML